LEACDCAAPTIHFQFDQPAGDVCKLDVELTQIAYMRTTHVAHSLAMSGQVAADGRELIMVFVESGSAAVRRGGRQLAFVRSGDCFITNLLRGDSFKASANAVRRVVVLPDHGISDVIARHFHITPPPSIAFTKVLHPRNASLGLLRDLARNAVISVAEAKGPFAAALAKQYADLMVTSLLLNVQNSFSETLAKASGAAETRYVRRALDFMRANLDQPLDLDEIATEADCSPRRLQTAFRAEYGITPMSMLKKMRLELAEQRLRSGEYASVAVLARSIGFGNPGRFAAEFRQRFGVLPSQVLAVNMN
jgi:AraC-like DNA-binding protein